MGPELLSFVRRLSIMSQKAQAHFLTSHFFDRFFDKEPIAAGSDPTTSVIQAASLLAVPGLMLTFWMRFSPYFFVSYSMIVMGFIMIFKWDSLFPDRRDYLILGSLPIRYRDLFLSKIKALFLFLAIFAVSANLFPTLAAPAGSRQGPVWMSFLAHVSGVFGGALFMIFGFGALQGILITILPERSFRRLSPIIQMISITVLLTIFLIFPLIQASIGPLVARSSALMHYFPIFWFYGLYISILPGSNPNPIFGALASKALYGLFFALSAFVITYAIAYRRHARSVLNAMDIHPPRDRGWRFLLASRIDRAILSQPVQHACFRFIGEILGRSARHQVFLAIYLSIGLSLSLSALFTVNSSAEFPFAISQNGMLALPLILSFFVISGLRATFNIPHELPGNWIFRMTDRRDSSQHVTATRKWVVLCGVLPLAVFVAVVEFAYWPARQAVFHLAYEAVVSIILVQILFFNFRKVPFTCSYFPGKKNMAIMAAVYLYGFTTYSSSMVALENWLLQRPTPALVFFIAGGAVIFALSSMRNRNRSSLIYEEQSEEQLQILNLN
jgi:hypothetical protein